MVQVEGSKVLGFVVEQVSMEQLPMRSTVRPQHTRNSWKKGPQGKMKGTPKPSTLFHPIP